MLTAEQLRAARAMKRMEQTKLAEKAGVSVETIKRLEAGEGRLKAQPQTLQRLRSALEAAGIEFQDGDEKGVRLRRNPAALIAQNISFEVMGAGEQIALRILKKQPELLDDPDKLSEEILKQMEVWLSALKQILPNRIRNLTGRPIKE